MLKKTVKYKNLRGEDRERVLYFHLNKAELMEMEYIKAGGFSGWLKSITENTDPKNVLSVLKMIILNSYGEISEDGESFDKSDELRRKFECSPAYEALILDLLEQEDGQGVAKFIMGVMPEDIAKKAAEEQAAIQKSTHPALSK